MPCASVSENPTRVSDENLNGGLRSVTRPSSRSITRHAKRRVVGPGSVEKLEDLVALAFHQLFRERLEVEPEQRLRVRRPHVQMPVLGLDRDPVQVRDLALGAEALLDLLELHGDVRHRNVDLTGQEEALAV